MFLLTYLLTFGIIRVLEYSKGSSIRETRVVKSSSCTALVANEHFHPESGPGGLQLSGPGV